MCSDLSKKTEEECQGEYIVFINSDINKPVVKPREWSRYAFHYDNVGAGMMGSTHTYDLPGATGSKSRLDTGAVEMALNPDEVDMIDSDAMQARAEAALREKQASLANEDLSDMVAEHAARQTNKRKRQEGKQEAKSSKKYKEFKF